SGQPHADLGAVPRGDRVRGARPAPVRHLRAGIRPRGGTRPAAGRGRRGGRLHAEVRRAVTLTGRAPASGRLDVVLVAAFPELSRARPARLVKEGRVTVDGRGAARPAEGCPEGAEL